MSKKINITKKFLTKEYLTNKKSSIEIAKELKCNKVTICRYLKEMGIKRPKISKDFLIKEYINNNKTIYQIAKILEVKVGKICYWAKKYNIKMRTNSESHKTQHASPKTEFKKGQKAWNKGLKGYCEVTEDTRLKISQASTGKNNGMFGKGYLLKREKNGRWLGGMSKEPYPFEFDSELKEKIRQRDHYRCQICGKTQEENHRALDVHHIDYDKDNIKLENLISLCPKCHCRTNNNRNYWKEYFKSKELINA
jgi:hypothetical protein